MKDVAGKAKSVVSVLHDAAGGTLGASSASELPRNRRQIYNNRQVRRPLLIVATRWILFLN